VTGGKITEVVGATSSEGFLSAINFGSLSYSSANMYDGRRNRLVVWQLVLWPIKVVFYRRTILANAFAAHSRLVAKQFDCILHNTGGHFVNAFAECCFDSACPVENMFCDQTNIVHRYL